MARRSDASLRFFRYVLSCPGVGSYYPPPKGAEAVDASRVFQYVCMPLKKFIHHVEDTVMGKQPLALPSRLPPRKILPPPWDEKDGRAIQSLLRRKNIEVIVFPLLLRAKENHCTKRDVDHVVDHMCVVAYHKASRQFELWDDLFLHNQGFFGYEDLLGKHLSMFMGPYLETFGEEPLEEIAVPMMVESAVAYGLSLLSHRELHADIPTLYQAFLVNYVHTRPHSARMAPLPTFVEGVPRPNTKKEARDAFFARYLAFLVETNQDRNTGSPHMRSRVRSRMLKDQVTQIPIFTPCPENQVRDLDTHECLEMDEEMKRATVDQHLLKGKHYYPSHITNFYIHILLYLLDKYPNSTAMLSKRYTTSAHPSEYCLLWKKQTRRKVTEAKYRLIKPEGFDAFVEAAIKAPLDQVRFVLFPVFINGDHGGHVNAVILDKKLHTLERFEPNDTYAYVRNPRDDLGNGALLDEALQALFAPYNLTYVDAMAACIAGFHAHEFYEREQNVHNLGGRCAEWSLWYMDVRLQNPDIPRERLLSKALEQIRKLGSFKHYISGYMAFLVQMSRKYRDRKKAKQVRGQQKRTDAGGIVEFAVTRS